MKRTLPEGFIAMMRSYGVAAAEDLLEGLANSDASTAVRANTLRGFKAADGFTAVPWLESGIYLPERPVFATDPRWHQGAYYVQDASSMALTAVVKELADKYFGGRPLRYLDACAAPGGKTIAAIEALPASSAVLANEYDRRRASALVENVGKHGFASVAITCGDASRLAALGEIFDIVAVDAPCSGEGMMRKEPEAINQWSEGLIKSCAATQRDILDATWHALRPGGFMIYSTCTFNTLEDEANVQYMIDTYGAESIATCLAGYDAIQPAIGIDAHCCRFFPGIVDGEGLFLSVLRKPEGDAKAPKVKSVKQKPVPAVEKFAREHLDSADNYVSRTDRNGITSVVPAKDADFFDLVADKLATLRCGLPLCTLKGDTPVPAWELAFSTALRRGSFPEFELDYAGAMAYLHGDSLTDMPEGLPKGFALACYKSAPLGFVKNIGRRANNLYPDALRLRLDPSALKAPEIQLVK